MESERIIDRLDAFMRQKGYNDTLGLNKKAADKTLTDSVLSVFLFADSNKTTPKAMKNAPIFGRGRSK